jgi:hypothetical protein
MSLFQSPSRVRSLTRYVLTTMNSPASVLRLYRLDVNGSNASQKPHDLAGAGGGHGGQQQAVAQTIGLDLGLQRIPVVHTAGGLYAPKVELQLALRGRAAVKRGVRALVTRPGGGACRRSHLVLLVLVGVQVMLQILLFLYAPRDPPRLPQPAAVRHAGA